MPESGATVLAVTPPSVSEPAVIVAVSTVAPVVGRNATSTSSPSSCAAPSAEPAAGETSCAVGVSTMKVNVCAGVAVPALSVHVPPKTSEYVPATNIPVRA